MNNQYFVAVQIDGEPLAIMGILSKGRGSILPSGAEWIGDGWWSRPPTDAVILQEVSRAFAAKPVMGYRRIEPSEIPADRSYRNALRDSGEGPLEFDMPKARELHLGKLKRERVGKMAELDIEFIRHVTRDGKKAEAIEAQKQALRDMPQTLEPVLEACATVDELKRVTLPR